jgi:hypothetical protein
VHPRNRLGTDAGTDDTGLSKVDVLGAVVLDKAAPVTLGEAFGCLPRRLLLVTGLHQRLGDALEQPRPPTVLVVDGTAGVDHERGTGLVLHLVEPLPVRDDGPDDDKATEGEDDTRAVVLVLGHCVDRPDHGLERSVDPRHGLTSGSHAGSVLPVTPL